MAASSRRSAGRERPDNLGVLTGGGPSQVGISGALRARDVSRPTEEQLAEAERLVQVSRRPPRPRAQADRPGRGGSSPERS